MDGEVRGRRVLVTGASGFIGSHLTRRLVHDGADVHALTSAVSCIFPPRLLDVRDGVTLHEGSLTDRGAMEAVAAAADPELVFHLGAYTHVGKSWQRADECVQVNVAGTVNLLSALAPGGLASYQRLVSTGTSEIYGDVPVPFREDGPVNPVSPYAVSKYAAERMCRMFVAGRGWPIVCVRPFNAYGPAQSPDRVVPELVVRALAGRDVPMTQGRQTRELNYVEDLVDGFVRAAVTPGLDGGLYNLGGGAEMTMRDLAATVLRLVGGPARALFGALPERPTEITRMVCDASRARRDLGWEPRVGLEEGLARTIRWYDEELSRGTSSYGVGVG